MQNFEVNRSTFHGILSEPNTGEGIGILLLHAWWGLNRFMIDTCNRLSQAGFVTLSPDYYDGVIDNTIEDAKIARGKMDRKSVQKIIDLAVDYLSTLNSVTGSGIGVIGFSLGAGFAIEAARSNSKVVKSVVLFYGTSGGKLDKTKASFQGHFAEHDVWGAHSQKVQALSERIRSAGKSAQFYTYPNTEHWFAEADRPEYNKDAAVISWQRTIQYLQDEFA